MRKALISPEEEVQYGYETFAIRIAEVVDEEYPVCPPCYWMDCEDDVTTDTHCLKDGQIVFWPRPSWDSENSVFINPYSDPDADPDPE